MSGSLSVDPVVVRENWLRAYDFVTDRAATTLNEYASANDPFADVGRSSRTVDVVSVVRVSDDSFQARWIEKTYENGALVRRQTIHRQFHNHNPRRPTQRPCAPTRSAFTSIASTGAKISYQQTSLQE